MSASQRRKGADAERAVVRYLRANGWPDARRYLAGDGRQPGDIDWHPLICLEVKDRRQSAWPSWCRQAAAEARPGMIPVVVRKTAPADRQGEWEARMLDGDVWVSTTLAGVVAAVAHIDQEPAAPEGATG